MKTQNIFLKHQSTDAFYEYVMIRATSNIPSNYKRVSGTCAFIAFTRAPGIGLKDRMHIIVHIKMGPDARKPDIGACEQQRRRPVIVSTQSDQRLYCSRTGNYI